MSGRGPKAAEAAAKPPQNLCQPQDMPEELPLQHQSAPKQHQTSLILLVQRQRHPKPPNAAPKSTPAPNPPPDLLLQPQSHPITSYCCTRISYCSPKSSPKPHHCTKAPQISSRLPPPHLQGLPLQPRHGDGPSPQWCNTDIQGTLRGQRGDSAGTHHDTGTGASLLCFSCHAKAMQGGGGWGGGREQREERRALGSACGAGTAPPARVRGWGQHAAVPSSKGGMCTPTRTPRRRGGLLLCVKLYQVCIYGSFVLWN